MSRCPDAQRWLETRVGSLYVLGFSSLWGSGGDACYSLKCLESVSFPLQSVSFLCSRGDVFAWRPGGKRPALWPCEPRPQQCEVEEGVAVALLDTCGLRVLLQDTAGRVWLLAVCYHWEERKKAGCQGLYSCGGQLEEWQAYWFVS